MASSIPLLNYSLNTSEMIKCETIEHIEYSHDFDIIDRILEGDKSLFAILIKRNNTYLYKAGRAYNYNHEDTQDLMQDSFIDAYMNLSKFEKRSSFRTWILRIMINNCFKKKQKSSFKNESSEEINDYATPMFQNTNSDTQHMILAKELNDIIVSALMEVPEDFRMVFTLREISGLNVKETAEVLQISEANVKVRLNRAKSMLRKKVELSYSPQDIFEFNLVYCDRMVDRVMSKIKETEQSEL